MANDQVKVTITAEDATRSAFRSVESSLRGLQGSAASALAGLGALGAGLSVAGLVSGLRTTVDSMDALNDASDRTGSSVEELSSLLNTLSPYGATLDQITDATGKLARAMAGADDETKGAGAAFAALGISTRDAAGNLRPAVDVLDDVARALAQYEDGTNKTVLAQTIFGKTGAALLPLLKDLANAQKAAASVTTEQAQAAEAFNVQLGIVSRNLDALKVQLAGPVITALNGIVERFNAAGNSAENFYNRLRLTLQPDSEIARLTGNVGKLEAELRSLESVKVLPEFELDRLAQIDVVTKRLAQARKELADAGPVQAIRQRDNAALRAVEDRGFTPRPGAAPSLPGGGGARPGGTARATEERVRSFEDYATRIQAAVARLVTDNDLVQAAELRDTLGGLDKLFFDGAISADVYEAALSKLFKTTRTDGSEGQRRFEADLERTTEQIRDAVDPTRALYRELDRVRELVNSGALGQEFGNARQAQILSQIDGILGGKLPEAVGAATSAAREFGLTFTSALEDAVVGGKKVGDMLKGLEADILRVLVRQQITGPLLDLLGGTFDSKKSGGTIAGSIFAALGLTRAAGGPVSAGVPYLVGERGPELIVPKSAGTVVPNGAFGGVTIVNNIDSRADRSAISADIQRSQLASLAMLQDMRARGKAA
jgi:hypothetical protein